MEAIGEVTLINTGEECDVEWKMDFTSLSESVGKFYRSPQFSFEGDSWYLAMWPNGCERTYSAGYVDLRLWRLSCNGFPMKVKFTFALKTMNGQKILERKRTKHFEGTSVHDTYRFISKSDFEKRQSEFLASGFLTVVCTLKNVTSSRIASGGATQGCSNSKRSLNADIVSPCKKKCMTKAAKCPKFSTVIDLQINEMESVKEKQPETITGHHSPQEGRISPDSGVSIHLEALSRDLSKLLNKSSNYDVRITCEGKTFNAHRIILGMRSTVFAAMFDNDMVEGETGLIKVEDFSASILEGFLWYLYCGILPEMNGETAKQFYEIAEKYAIEDLKQTCLDFLTKSLYKNNACEILVFADQHSNQDFRKKVISYIIEEKIPEHVRWLDFSMSYPILAVEVLNLYVRKNCSN